MTERIVLAAAVVCLLVAGAAPVLSMFVQSLFPDGHFSLDAYKTIFNKSYVLLLGNSVALSSIVTFLCVITGVPLGLLLGKTNLPFRQALAFLFTIPLLIPPYIVAVSWFDLFARNGIISGIVGPRAARACCDFLFGLPGCSAVLFSIFLPIPMLLTMVFLKTVNPRLEEAGRLVSRWPGVISGISLPLITHGILLSAVLVFLLTLGEFSVPEFLRYRVFPVESFTRFTAFYDFGSATAAALPLALVTLLILLFETRYLKDKTYRIHLMPSTEDSFTIDLGRLRYFLATAVSIACFIIVVVPVLILIVSSAHTGSYLEAFRRGGAGLLRSVLYAAAGASLLTILGFFTGYLIHNRSFRFWRSVDSLTIFLFALPGTVTGIGLISLWNRPMTNFIYATPAIIILGYLARYTALTSRITVSTLACIPRSMDEAARVAGAGWIDRIRGIHLPLARRGIVAAWLVAYIFALRDTEITMLVYPPGRETLPVRIFTLMANGSPELTAALCVIMTAAVLLPLPVIWLLMRGPNLELS